MGEKKTGPPLGGPDWGLFPVGVSGKILIQRTIISLLLEIFFIKPIRRMAQTDPIRGVMARLHQLQNRLGELNSRLRHRPEVLENQEKNIRKVLFEQEKLKETQKQLQLEARKKEQEVSLSDQALAKRKVQLSEAKTNKEYQALQHQIKADEATRSILDDEALEAMDKAEKFAEKFLPVDAELAKAKELFENTRKKFLAEKPGIEAEIARLGAQLKDTEAELPRDFREIYDRLVRSVGGENALAAVENQKYCGGCNYQVPINSLAMILQRIPITCSSCARLLYVDEEFVFDKG